MIDQLSILLGICGILYILFWIVKNDDAQSIQDQKGWLRLRAPSDAKSGSKSDEKSGALKSGRIPPSRNGQPQKIRRR
ncbi:hypothetical protein JCM17846_25230 [Iodidimonas nitroreducens]|uniref:Uncharacterized protein n=1 Tax=Iodidimonas nitroreducens TaxID=1236968 RepID=A0A5A7N930_9PROT|nr:hypothetical protein [Iodidimonas nitroreducens]GAK32239.1 hypothetical protein AQ1_00103 [alpha proteobacterium Q-1]GER04841.1 hypothetical protein JCM17846_25230 [Iodidimonas nitroreducens]